MTPRAAMSHEDDTRAGNAARSPGDSGPRDTGLGADPEPGRSMTGASRAPQNEIGSPIDSTSGPALKLDVIRDAGDWSALGPVEELVEAVASVLAGHHAAQDALPAGVALLLSDDDHIRDLSYRFRGQDAPTNVLSFPSAPFAQVPNHQPDSAAAGTPSGEGVETFLGDIILAAETIIREAVEQDKAPAHHFQHLVLHGLLHLLGYDHESERDAIKMENLEIELLQSLNIRNPYAHENCTAAN